MKELKKAREYKSKKKLITEEPSSSQKILKYPKRAQKQQDSSTVSISKHGYQTPELSTIDVGFDDDKEAGKEDKDDNPRVDKIVVRKFKTSQSF